MKFYKHFFLIILIFSMSFVFAQEDELEEEVINFSNFADVQGLLEEKIEEGHKTDHLPADEILDIRDTTNNLSYSFAKIMNVDASKNNPDSTYENKLLNLAEGVFVLATAYRGHRMIVGKAELESIPLRATEASRPVSNRSIRNFLDNTTTDFSRGFNYAIGRKNKTLPGAKVFQSVDNTTERTVYSKLTADHGGDVIDKRVIVTTHSLVSNADAAKKRLGVFTKTLLDDSLIVKVTSENGGTYFSPDAAKSRRINSSSIIDLGNGDFLGQRPLIKQDLKVLGRLRDYKYKTSKKFRLVKAYKADEHLLQRMSNDLNIIEKNGLYTKGVYIQTIRKTGAIKKVAGVAILVIDLILTADTVNDFFGSGAELQELPDTLK